MKIPEIPPDAQSILSETFSKNREKGLDILNRFQPTDSKGKYRHWQILKYLEPPEDFTSKEWWAGIKISRQKLYKELNFFDKKGEGFKFAIPDCVLESLLFLEKYAAGNINMDQSITNHESRNTYLVSSLFEEAITSSQMEGAATTYKNAKEMLLAGRKPVGISEQMITNNYQAMRFIDEFKNEQLTIEMIKELHRILTEKTLPNPEDAGNLRTSEDDISVKDQRDGTTLHIPPKAEELPKRMELLCNFANEFDQTVFIPVPLKAIILHFMLAYDHPFVDGNGRTARALFYWYMAKNNYWMIRYVSISKVLKNEFGKYKDSYLHVETDENDLTYFLIHQLSVIRKAINALNKYLKKKSKEIESTKQLLESKSKLIQKLNYRQLVLLRHALDHPKFVYTIESHQNSHGIAYQTARTDLLKMSDEYRLLSKEKAGRTFIFISPPDLKKRITTKFN